MSVEIDKRGKEQSMCAIHLVPIIMELKIEALVGINKLCFCLSLFQSNGDFFFFCCLEVFSGFD